MEITLRKARPKDLKKLIEVERGATPNLSYVPNVFDAFVSDEEGEFIVAEADGEVAACGKFTVAPDGSAWLETLRVLPRFQGLGIGKRFYERFFEIVRRKDIRTMRMYTGLSNVVSKGLAERFGFRLAATLRGASIPCRPGALPLRTAFFNQVSDPEEATSLIMPLREKWGGFLVMNRTFYAITPALCAHLAAEGQVYRGSATGSVITLGARFMPEQALHIGVFGGDAGDCLSFALQKGLERSVGRLSCLFPSTAGDIEETLTGCGFQLEKSDFIVMEANLP